MNLDQMEFRCPDAEVIGNVMVKDYRLAFRGNSRGNGVASILPEQGEQGILNPAKETKRQKMSAGGIICSSRTRKVKKWGGK